MDKVFQVEIWNKDHDTTLWLPLTNYELLDVMDKLRVVEDVAPSVAILQYSENFQNLEVIMQDDLNLFELNALAVRLSQFEPDDVMALHALVSTRLERSEENIPVKELLDLAYSTDCCEVHPGVKSFDELGHFCVENDLIPELKGTPESALPFLDYTGIGKKYSKAECGVLVPGGYVTQTEELKEISKTMDFSPRKPDYTVLLALTFEQKQTNLALPAEFPMLENAMKKLGASDLSKVGLRCLDCCAPSLISTIGDEDNVAHIYRLAQKMEEMDSQQLIKFKAVLNATESNTVLGATHIAYNLDEYLFSPQLLYAEDVGKDFLESEVGVSELTTLLPYVNLHGYGEALIKEFKGCLTKYGLVSREDEQSLKTSLMPASHPEMSDMPM